MRLLAALAIGVFVYFLVGYATDHPPAVRFRRRDQRAPVSRRQVWLHQAGVAS